MSRFYIILLLVGWLYCFVCKIKEVTDWVIVGFVSLLCRLKLSRVARRESAVCNGCSAGLLLLIKLVWFGERAKCYMQYEPWTLIIILHFTQNWMDWIFSKVNVFMINIFFVYFNFNNKIKSTILCFYFPIAIGYHLPDDLTPVD